MPFPRRSAWPARVIALAIFAACAVWPQSSAPQAVVGRIHITGNSRFTEEQIASACGLTAGSPVNAQILSGAAAKLNASGAFSEVRYSYSFTSKYWAIDLQVAETAQFLPATFDNFVWFSDDELLSAAKRASPLFDGNLPEGGNLKDGVAGALTEFLHAKHLPGTVTATAAAGSGKNFAGYVLRISGVQIPVLGIEVEGGPVDPKLLEPAERNIIGHDYSQFSAGLLARSALTEAYQDEGYLRPHFSAPNVVMHDPTNHEASQGVVVKFAVAAGKRYTWGGAQFSGNHVLSNEDLARIVGIANGEIARRNKTQDGWKAIGREMGHKGYVALQMQAMPAYDDAASIVRFNVLMDEGAQYTMGELKIDETAPKVVKLISEAWKIPRGQIYDSVAEQKFVEEDGPKAVELSGTMRNHMTFHRTLHPETHMVDVHLEFQ